MIGNQDIQVTLLPVTGDRRDMSIRVIGPGTTDYTFPLSVTRTQQTVWKISDRDLPAAMDELAAGIMSVRGTASAPPSDGYWFDSYNSEGTIKATVDKIRNFGEASFLKNRTVSDEIAAIFGGGLVHELEIASQQFLEIAGVPLIGSLDYAFERSEADADLASAPRNKAEFLYRVCILSVIVDAFRVRLPIEPRGTLSLQALKNWLSAQVGDERAMELTATFARVKDVRKQYPIHDHFERDEEGQRVVRQEVQRGEEHFGFRDVDDYETKWKKVIDAFQAAVHDLRVVVGGEPE